MEATTTHNANQQTQENSLSAKDKIKYSLYVSAIIAGILFFGDKSYKDKKADKEDSQSFEDGAAATNAKEIRLALLNKRDIGIDINGLRIILIGIKSKAQMTDIYNSYITQFHVSMYSDISSRMRLSEYQEMVQIVEGKPVTSGKVPSIIQYNAWAKRIKCGFDKKWLFFEATDMLCIRAVFTEVPTQVAFINVATSYYNFFKANVLTVLKAELRANEYMEYMKLLTDKPKGK